MVREHGGGSMGLPGGVRGRNHAEELLLEWRFTQKGLLSSGAGEESHREETQAEVPRQEQMCSPGEWHVCGVQGLECREHEGGWF